MQVLTLIALFSGVAAGKLTSEKLKLDDNQVVTIEGQPILGNGAGSGALNVCRSLPQSLSQNMAMPAVDVCGTGIKATFYLRNRCEGYYEHSQEIGVCDPGAPPSSCASFSPQDDARFGAYQSYIIEQCGPGH